VVLLRRNPDIIRLEIDDTVFLVGTDNDSVFHLNPIGAAIWKLLAKSANEEDVTQTLVEAFPDLPTEQVNSDVEKLFRDLESRGFLLKLD